MKKPNIVFLFCDQFRKSAMSLWADPRYKDHILGEGDPVKTPNLDRLAEGGIVISGAYSSYPVCSPFRAMLFSGRYPEGNGVWQNCAPGRPDELRADIPTFTDILADDGYSVGYVGKWHLERPEADFSRNGEYIGDDPDYSYERFFPDGSGDKNTACWDTLIKKRRQRKIDYLYAYNTWDVFRKLDTTPELSSPHYWDKDGKRHTAPKGQWSPDFETDLALSFIKNEHGERDAGKPYAIFLSYNPPHSPYASRNDTDYLSYDSLYSSSAVPDGRELIKRDNVTLESEEFTEKTRVYFSHVSGIDRCIGRVLSEIPKDELENTVIIFTADHGEMLGSHGLMAKNVPYEEATAIPFIISYKGTLAPGCDSLLLSGADIMPTVLSLVGTRIPEGIEGRDYSELLKSGVGIRPRSALFTQPKRKGVRTDKYLFTLTYDTDEQFKDARIYDLCADPYQLCPLSPSDIDKADMDELWRELGRNLSETSDPWCKKQLYSEYIPYH